MINKIITKFKREGALSLILSMIKYPFNYKKRIKYRQMLSGSNIKSRFNEIYKNNLWSSNESFSGEGSTKSYTEPLQTWLIENLPKLKVKHLIDAPCGDFNWMRFVIPKLNLTYLGIDIVPALIKKNREVYGQENISFLCANICEDVIPNCDMIMVRDCLFHLSNNDIAKFLKNLHSVNYRYLLTTNHIITENFQNTDIISGDFRFIDIFRPPFNFDKSKVISFVNDYPKGYKIPKEMVLLKKEDVPVTF